MERQAFAALIPVGPEEVHTTMAADLLDSLWYYEPEVSWVVLVDDVPGRLRTLQHGGPPSCHVVVLDNPRMGRGSGRFGSLCAGVVAGMAWIQCHTDAHMIVKMDTDALVISPFADSITRVFNDNPTTGQVGTYTMSPTGRSRPGTYWAGPVRSYERLIKLERSGPARRRLGLAMLGWRRRFRGQIRRARANGYEYGRHCQGGAYAVSREALNRMAAAGYLDRPCTWLKAHLSEDVLVSILVNAVGLVPADLCREGEPFGVVWRGLPFPPPLLVQRGYSLIHSVRNDPTFSEAQVRSFFKQRRV